MCIIVGVNFPVGIWCEFLTVRWRGRGGGTSSIPSSAYSTDNNVFVLKYLEGPMGGYMDLDPAGSFHFFPSYLINAIFLFTQKVHLNT